MGSDITPGRWKVMDDGVTVVTDAGQLICVCVNRDDAALVAAAPFLAAQLGETYARRHYGNGTDKPTATRENIEHVMDPIGGPHAWDGRPVR